MLSLNALWLRGSVPVTVRPPVRAIDRSRQQHVVVWHPHGAYTAMAFMHCAHCTVSGQPLAWYPAIAPLLFRAPLFREMAMRVNARSVTAQGRVPAARRGRARARAARSGSPYDVGRGCGDIRPT